MFGWLVCFDVSSCRNNCLHKHFIKTLQNCSLTAHILEDNFKYSMSCTGRYASLGYIESYTLRCLFFQRSRIATGYTAHCSPAFTSTCHMQKPTWIEAMTCNYFQTRLSLQAHSASLKVIHSLLFYQFVSLPSDLLQTNVIFLLRK